MFAISMVAFGFQNIWYKGFVKGLELTPEWAPGHTFWAYLIGAVLIGGGVSIAVRKKARLGAAALGLLYFASVVFLRLPRIGLAMHDLSERTVLLEPVAIGCGAWLLTGMRGPFRVLFGIVMIVFGIDHFEVLPFIAKLIPTWIPGAMFWSAFTGAALVAAGLSIITRWRMRWGAGLLGLMFFLWVVVLHGPRVIASFQNGNEWNSLFVALAMCGASWILVE